MRLLYNAEHKPLLYGHVAFYKQTQPNQIVFDKPIRSSRPFVIGRFKTGSADLVVFGSVHFLTKEIQRLIDESFERNESWWSSRQDTNGNQSELDYQYYAHVMDFVILVSTYSRNLFHILNSEEITGKTIPMLNYEKEAVGDVKLNELFDILIHNRYYYFDGRIIRDIFSDKQKKKSQISNKFMGFGIELQDYVQGIVDTLRNVRMKHLISILRGRFKQLNSNTKIQDVIFLIQNVHSFSDLMKTLIPSENYTLIEHLIFGDRLKEDIVYKSPTISIHPDLHLKSFIVRVRFSTKSDYDRDNERLTKHEVTVGYESLFETVHKLFGDERLVDLVLTEEAIRKKAFNTTFET